GPGKTTGTRKRLLRRSSALQESSSAARIAYSSSSFFAPEEEGPRRLPRRLIVRSCRRRSARFKATIRFSSSHAMRVARQRWRGVWSVSRVGERKLENWAEGAVMERIVLAYSRG